jgi:peptidoglycan hydrolase-like protein with peptidoglycan-binding domain
MKVGDNMEVKEFQAMTGLVADGIVGEKTKARAKEVLQACQDILGNNFNSPEEVVKATQSSPDYWMDKLMTIKYFDSFIMNIVNRMGGAK